MDNVKPGFWRDYGLPGLQSYQYLIPEKRANMISNTIAVALTLALPRIYVLMKRSIPKFLDLYRRIVELNIPSRFRRASKRVFEEIRAALGRTPPHASTEVTVLELNATTDSGGDQQRRIFTGVLATIQDSTTAEDAVSRLARRHLAMPKITVGANVFNLHGLHRMFKNLLEEPRSAIYILMCMLFLLAIFIGLQVIAISSSFIIGGSAATIKAGACAYYITTRRPLPSTWPDVLGFSVHHDFHSALTESALAYADACYQSTQSMTPCPFALTRSIPHTVLTDNDCPFPAKAMCKFGNGSVLTMDSGFVDARLLGINSPSSFEFRRRTSCSPVLDNETFVQIHNVSENIAKIEYRYHDEGVTWPGGFSERRHLDYNDIIMAYSGRNNRVPDAYLNKAYDVQIYQTPLSQRSQFDHGQLLPDLVLPYAATTLFLVSKGEVIYYAKSSDPIFPAQSLAHSSWPQESRWSHLGLARTVLGCVDEKYIRDRKKKYEWNLLGGQLHNTVSNQTWNMTPPSLVDVNNTPYSDEDFTALQLLCLALRYSDTASAVQYARSTWLDAASRIVEVAEGQMSLPLDPYQWRIESHKLFNISLARMQTEIIYITRTDQKAHEDPKDYLENFFNGMPVDPCGLIKMSAEGWRNISVVGFAGMLGLALGLWLITMETGDTIVLIWLYRTIAQPLSLHALASTRFACHIAVKGISNTILWISKKL